MLIEIQSRQTIMHDMIEESVRLSSPALDELWRTKAVRDSIAGNDTELISRLGPVAREIRESSDAVLVAAGVRESAAIKAALSAVEEGSGAPEVIVIGTRLSAAGYASMLEKLDGKRVSLVAVSCGEEDLALRAAYAILKSYVFAAAKDTGSKAGIYAVVGTGSVTIACDAADNEYPLIRLPEGTDPGLLANTAAVILPLMIKGADVNSYIDAFAETVASPEWDAEGAVTACLMSKAADRIFETWQDEYCDMVRWLASAGGRAIIMPEESSVKEKMISGGDVFELLIGSDEGHDDVMTPLFEGCDPDGSLALLTLSESEHDFFAREGGHGVKLKAERADSAACGALMAFCQMTIYIADHIKE